MTAAPAFARLIRDVRDFPQPGIVFKDITPLLADATGFADALAAMAAPWRAHGITHVAGVEARGFILGAALARELGAGFVPLRKAGKLPADVVGENYMLEYGVARIEVHADAVPARAAVLLVDDVLATGGTLRAARSLLERVGARLLGAGVLIELAALDGRAQWGSGVPLHAVLRC
ncbi:MAG TPA: adenine phosphoribosyltransferase [Lysobacter sp.]|nr:adenine phosphoribosyltransferase [Lysobacter sp.]